MGQMGQRCKRVKDVNASNMHIGQRCIRVRVAYESAVFDGIKRCLPAKHDSILVMSMTLLWSRSLDKTSGQDNHLAVFVKHGKRFKNEQGSVSVVGKVAKLGRNGLDRYGLS
ncbi:hypothetical protein Tco_0616251 [Tanacetum coccineum]